jgi:hypothetical protein
MSVGSEHTAEPEPRSTPIGGHSCTGLLLSRAPRERRHRRFARRLVAVRGVLAGPRVLAAERACLFAEVAAFAATAAEVALL